MKIIFRILLIYSISVTNQIKSSEFVYRNSLDIPLTIGASAAFGTGYYLRNTENESDNYFELSQNSWINRNIDNYFSFNENKFLSEASDYLLYGILAAPVVYTLAKSNYDDFWFNGLMLAQVQLFNVGFNFAVKDIVNRERPFVANQSELKVVNNYDETTSFYSGHTTVAFASAIFLGIINEEQFKNHKYSGLFWSLGLGVATSTGLLRILSGKHYLTDVIIGAVAGSLISYTILEIHKKNNNNSEELPINRISINFKL